MAVLIYLIVIFIILLSYLFIEMKKKLSYWQILGIEHPKPLPFFGNSLPIFLKQSSLSDICLKEYYSFPSEKMIGIFDFVTPTLIVKDPYLLEKILIKDFQHFTDHSVDNQSGDLFSHTLFQMTGDRWKSARYKMTPMFTSGKLKLMFQQMLDCSEKMIHKLDQPIVLEDVEMKNILSMYSLDIIVNVVFGVEFSKEESKEEFIQMCSSIFDTNHLKFFHMFLLLHFPKLANKIGITFASKKIDEYFRRIIQEAFEQRKSGVGQQQKYDYIQLLQKLKEKGQINVIDKDDDEDEYLNLNDNTIAGNFHITEDLLAGQAFQFLTAGLDPVFLSMNYTMYELAKNQQIQDCLRQEIKKVIANNNGYTYQAIKEMHYLEQCIQESLRLYPIAPILFRQCTKRYITEDGVELEKGLKLIIPVAAIHKDSQYYPNPNKFEPDRFAKDAKGINNFTYLPFGDGPRICLGTRFAMILMKIGLAKIIENFRFTLSKSTKEPLEYNKLAFLTVVTNKILFNMEPVK